MSQRRIPPRTTNALAIGFCVTHALLAQEADSQTAFKIEKSSEPAGWNIFKGEQLVAGYVFDSNGKPIVYPVVGPAGGAIVVSRDQQPVATVIN